MLQNKFDQISPVDRVQREKNWHCTPYILYVSSAAITSEDTFQNVDNHFFARNKDFPFLEVPKEHIFWQEGLFTIDNRESMI